jgi:hypothetical protein
MLRAFKGSLHKALELEAAIPPLAIRFEKQCNLYCLQALRFSKNHPIKLSSTGVLRDKLALSSSLEDNSKILSLQPTM